MHSTDVADDWCFLTKALILDFWLAVSLLCFAFQPLTSLEKEVLLGEAEATWDIGLSPKALRESNRDRAIAFECKIFSFI
jgi:hypothetical protein